MLKFAGVPYKMPTNVFVHGFLTALGEKMSKSRGTGVSPDSLPRPRARFGMAALLHRGQVERPGRGHRLQSRRLRRAGEQRSHRQVREHRQPGREVHHRAVRWCRCRSRRRMSHCFVKTFVPGHRDAAARYDARQYSQVVRDAMAVADGFNEAFDKAKPWALAKDTSRRAELQSICSRALFGFKYLTVILAPILPALASVVSRRLFGLDRRFRLGRRDRTTNTDWPFAHLMHPHRPEADRRAGRWPGAHGASQARRDRQHPSRNR